MSPFWLAVIGLCCSAVLAITGCVPPSSPGVAADMYKAAQRPVASGKVTLPRVVNQLGGNVLIIAGRDGEVRGDADAIGIGNTLGAARIEADQHITLTSSAGGLEVRSQGALPQDNALLHLIVPAAADLPYVNTHSGNIGIYGRVGNVTAVISDVGNLEVYGADGNLNLSTPKGSINVDILNDHDLTLNAADGNIDIKALQTTSGTHVSAATKNGNINFWGNLHTGQSHQFTTTGAGSINMVIPTYPNGQPDNVVLRIQAVTSAQSIITEYPADRKDGKQALAICGVIDSPGPYDYHIENTAAHFGRLEISPVVTTTYHYSGTLTSTYYRFDTDQPRVSLFTPRAQAVHIYTAAEYAQIHANKVPVDPDCAAALTDNLNQSPTIVLNLHSGTGQIFIHHINFLQ